MVTGKQNCKLFSSAGLHSQKSVELRWSLCRSPMLSVSRPGTLCVGPDALCRGPALSVSGPGTVLCRAPALCSRLCVGAWRSLCHGPTLCMGPALLSGPAVSGPCALCVGALSVWARRSLPALCRGTSGNLSVGARRSLCRGRRSVSGPGSLCRGPTLSVSECSALCRSAARCLCLGAAVSISGPALSASRPGALCVGPSTLYVGARCSLCRGPALSASGPGALCRALAALSQRSLCQAPTLSLSGPGALRRSLRRGPALFVSGPDAVMSLPCVGLCVGGGRSFSNARCVGFWRSLCRGPALSVSGPGTFCVRARRSLEVCVGARQSSPNPAWATHPVPRDPSSDLRSSIRPRAPAQIPVPPIQPGTFPFYCLGDDTKSLETCRKTL